MQGLVPIPTARTFAQVFYHQLLQHGLVDLAANEARASVKTADLSGAAIPVTFMRLRDGRLLEVRSQEETAYLEALTAQYRFWAEKYTFLAGIAEVRAATASGPRLDLPTLFMSHALEKLEKYFGTEGPVKRVPIDDLRKAVAEHPRLVLLGEPGSGKTTTLWRLAYDYAIAALSDPQAPLPLLAPLGAYTGPEPAQRYVQGYFGELGAFLPDYLKSSRAILLLDGLNEMPQKDYRDRVKRIQALLDLYPSASVVVTCRALDYVESLRLEKLEIKPLDTERQRAYLHRYLDVREGEKLFWLLAGEGVARLWDVWQGAGGTWEQFLTAEKMPDGMYKLTSGTWDGGGQRMLWQHLREGWLPPMWALGQNPFMLVMLAQVYASQGTLPQNRGKLFTAFADTLLERERELSNPEQWPGSDTLQRSLSRLAFAMQGSGERGTAVERVWALKQMGDGVDPERMLYLAASATLLDTSGEKMRFVHQLIQEYFAALALGERLEQDEDLRHYWPKGWVDPSGWEETCVLLAGILPDMTPLVKQLLVANPPLAARCIAESGGIRPDESMVQTVQQLLLDLLKNPRVAIRQRNAAGMAANYLGDARSGVGLRPDGLPDIDWVLVPDEDPKTGRREFIYQQNEQRTEPDFWMARYPITYRQFQAFLNAPDGFRNPRWWKMLAASDDHRNAWGEQFWKHWNHPRENVSWYDVMAFCHWLTAKAQEQPDLLPEALRGQTGWRITMPTEWQWEKAARGHDGRQYPWGKKYHKGYANIFETNWLGYFTGHFPGFLGKTSPVGMYLQGASPYGIHDLSGTVKEWCLNEYPSSERIQEEGSATRVLRGGGWSCSQIGAASSCRFENQPHLRDSYCGGRAVAVLPPP